MTKTDAPMLTRRQLAHILAGKLGISNIEGENTVRLITNAIIDQLKIGGRIEIRGLGNFDSKVVKGYDGHQPRSGQKISIAKRVKTTYKPSKILIKKLNNGCTPPSKRV